MIQIVAAQPSDFEIIRTLAYEIWPGTYGHILSKEQLDYMLDAFYSTQTLLKNATEKNHQFMLVIENGKHLGFISFEHQYENGPVTRIHKIYVLPETQGRGIGKMLIEKIEILARENHSERLSLNVNRYNSAQEFYKKLGFEITLEEDIEIGRGYLMEDYRMKKKL